MRLSATQIIAIVLLAVFTVFITWRVKSLEQLIANRSAVSEMVYKSAPPFSLPARDGRIVSLSDYAGKTVVVSYWASWCGPCKVELPELRDFYIHYHQPASTFEFLAISIDEQRSEAERYANEEKLPFPVLFDPDSKVADSFSVEAIPTLFIINKSGRINYAHTGLDESIQFRLMSELGIQFPGLDNGVNMSSGTKQ